MYFNSIDKNTPAIYVWLYFLGFKIVKNITHDDMVFVEFDPFGFSVKDLATGNIVLRSNSTDDLYPSPSTHGASTSSSTSLTFSAFSTSICHSRLGHPRIFCIIIVIM